MQAYQARAVDVYVLAEYAKHQQADSAYYKSKPYSARAKAVRQTLRSLRFMTTGTTAAFHVHLLRMATVHPMIGDRGTRTQQLEEV